MGSDEKPSEGPKPKAAGPSGRLTIANLRHDLLTPVNHIIGYGEMLEESAEDLAEETLTTDLETLVASGKKLLQLVKERVREETLVSGPDAVAQARDDICLETSRVTDLCSCIKGTCEPNLDSSFLADIDRIHGAATQLATDVQEKFVHSVGSRIDRQPCRNPPDVLYPAAEQIERISSASASDREITRVLFVDDIPANRDLMQRRLTELGYESDVAENGLVALEKLRSSSFDLVLLDIMMPVMDGHETLQAIKNDSVLCGLPVIMVTALNELDEVVNCVKMGADDYLGKDFNPMLLKARIEGCLERKRAKLRAKELGSYTLNRKIGAGGMGEVYLASHTMLRRPTAIKLLKPGMVSEESISYFHKEVQLTSQLTHPNTIAVYDYGRTPEGRFYFAMEYLDGMDLLNLVRCLGPLGEARTCHILIQVCSSLAEAHDHGLIHRDIKPANIMLCERGGIRDFVKVLDFGIAREMTSDQAGVARELVGTPRYMSPESITTPDRVDGRSDLYAVGCVGHYLLTGEPVFGTLSQVEQFSAHLRSTPPPVSQVVDHPVSPDLENLILRCLCKDPLDRPQTADELRKQLVACRLADQWTETDMRLWWEANRPSRSIEKASNTLSMTDVLALEVDLQSRVDEPTMMASDEDSPVD